MSNRSYFSYRKRKRVPRAPYAVAIVDMQDKYPAAWDPATVNGVVEVLHAAIADRAGIIMVNWRGWGNIRPEIRRLLRGYPFVHKVFKEIKDGSEEIASACRRHGFSRKHIVVCGIQTMVCVAATVEGLCNRLPLATIEVVKSACGDLKPPDWKRFPHPYVYTRFPQPIPPKPRNLVLNERLVGPLGPIWPAPSKAGEAHPNALKAWSKHVITGALPSSRPTTPYLGACRLQAQEEPLLLADKKNTE